MSTKTYNGKEIRRNRLYNYINSTPLKQRSLSIIHKELGLKLADASALATELVNEGKLTKFKIGIKVIYKAL